MKMSCAFALAAGAALSGCSGGGKDRPRVAAAPADWRTIATPADRDRLRDWRTAWVKALAQARGGASRADVAAQGVLLDPDRSIAGPVPPSGAYRCRVVKLGSPAGQGLDYVAYPAFACSIAAAAGGVTTFRKIGGSQRPVGTIYPVDDGRGVFLGTLMLSDETRAMKYGMDASRDMAGFVERIGDRRWRLVLPYPRFESILDVVDITAVS